MKQKNSSHICYFNYTYFYHLYLNIQFRPNVVNQRALVSAISFQLLSQSFPSLFERAHTNFQFQVYISVCLSPSAH